MKVFKQGVDEEAGVRFNGVYKAFLVVALVYYPKRLPNVGASSPRQ